MALYEYRCDEEHKVEISHPMAESPTVYCPKCLKIMKKQFGTPWINLKGQGFYSTDK